MSQILPNGKLANAKPSVDLASILDPVSQHLASVNQLLINEVNSCEPLVAQRLANSGIENGKRMRPALLLIAGSCVGDVKKTHIAAAAAIEMFHVATLVHDDVLDGATTRRHSPSLNVQWDNKTSILAGDFLFTKAMEIGCRCGSVAAVRRMASACSRVTTGEIVQNALAGDFTVTQQQYTEMVAAKTAELCQAACGLGAMLSECDDRLVQRFEKYGEDLGIAFQIIDDVLDLVGDQAVVGKTLGSDLLNQKATLPLILHLRKLAAGQRQQLLSNLQNQSFSVSEMVAQLNDSGAIDEARQIAMERANSALRFSQSLDRSPYAESLILLAKFVIQRLS